MVGSSYSFVVKVNVSLHQTFLVEDMTIEQGTDAVIYVANNEINKVSVNGVVLSENDYYVKDYSLHISQKSLNEGDNVVTINDTVTFTIIVKNMEVEPSKDSNETKKNGCASDIVSSVGLLTIIMMSGALVLLIKYLNKRKETL